MGLEEILVLVFVVIYFVLLILSLLSIDTKKKNIKGTIIIMVISTIVFIIGIVLYANTITPHHWVQRLNTSSYWENEIEFKKYIEANKVFINLKFYGGIILVIISYIGNIMAIVKNKNKDIKDNTKIID